MMTKILFCFVVLCFCVFSANAQLARKSCGTWGPWQSWGDCSKTCGGGTRTRVHICVRNATDTTRWLLFCHGTASQSENCNTLPCGGGPVHGNWGPWSAWSNPTVTCSNTQVIDVRTRQCNNPVPSNGGRQCVGPNSDKKVYPLPACSGGSTPVHGNWGSWTSWTEPTITCSNTQIIDVRVRKCDSPAPSNGGRPCAGSSQDRKIYPLPKCAPTPIDGNWGPWSAWTNPTVTCSNTQVIDMRRRKCDSPAPSNGGKPCPGQDSDSKVYPLPRCGVDGNWGPWSAWTNPTVTCSNTQVIDTRRRKCDSPAPSNGGKPCPGQDSDSKVYPLPRCGVDGNWGPWSAWSNPTITCSNTQVIDTRTRQCNNPAPSNGGKPCPGVNSEKKVYPLPRCPVNGNWGPWTAWSVPQITCSNVQVIDTRTRKCNSPAPSDGGAMCVGSDSDRKVYPLPPCAVDGGWSEWSSWAQPTITCSNKEVVDVRVRNCNSPAPSNGGKPCEGPANDKKIYPLPPCRGDGGHKPVHGNWGPWSSWTEPSVTCSDTPTVDLRNRKCDNPPPSNGGRPCFGRETDRKIYPLPACSDSNVNGQWGDWSPWSVTDVTCSDTPIMDLRTRLCDSPPPSVDGAPCEGENVDSQIYPLPPCKDDGEDGGDGDNGSGDNGDGDGDNGGRPVNGMWGPWSSWTIPTVTCSDTPTVDIRNRKCDRPAPRDGGRQCFGSATDTKIYPLPSCRQENVDGQWGDWSPWSITSATCSDTPINDLRHRLCDSPPPTPDGLACVGKDVERQIYPVPPCTGDIPSSWTPWSDWTSCDYVNEQTRYRVCWPMAGECPGSDSELKEC